MAAIPKPNPRMRTRPIRLPGDVANPANPPSGCYFHPRCIHRQDPCSRFSPEFFDTGNGHFVACPVRAGGKFLED